MNEEETKQNLLCDEVLDIVIEENNIIFLEKTKE